MILGGEGAPQTWEPADIEVALREYCEPDLVWDPIEAPAPSRGVEEAARSFSDWTEAMEDFVVELEEVLDAGDHVLAVTRQRARGKGSGAEVEQQIYQLFEFRAGRIVRFKEFADRDEALAALRSEDAG
jgi:ketosteroid isomerase-like protein